MKRAETHGPLQTNRGTPEGGLWRCGQRCQADVARCVEHRHLEYVLGQRLRPISGSGASISPQAGPGCRSKRRPSTFGGRHGTPPTTLRALRTTPPARTESGRGESEFVRGDSVLSGSRPGRIGPRENRDRSDELTPATALPRPDGSAPSCRRVHRFTARCCASWHTVGRPGVVHPRASKRRPGTECDCLPKPTRATLSRERDVEICSSSPSLADQLGTRMVNTTLATRTCSARTTPARSG
jgi:hypothetical protein